MGHLKQAECAPELAVSYRVEILLSATAFWRGQSNLEPGFSRWLKILRKRSSVFICSALEICVHYGEDSLFLCGFLNVTVFIIPRNNRFLVFRSRKSQTLFTSIHLILGGQTDKVTYQSLWSLHSCPSFSRKMVVLGACSKCVLSLKSPCNAWITCNAWMNYLHWAAHLEL